MCLPISFNISILFTIVTKTWVPLACLSSNMLQRPLVIQCKSSLIPWDINIINWQSSLVLNGMLLFYFTLCFLALLSFFFKLQPLRLCVYCLYFPNCSAMVACAFAANIASFASLKTHHWPGNRQMILKHPALPLVVSSGDGWNALNKLHLWQLVKVGITSLHGFDNIHIIINELLCTVSNDVSIYLF